MIFTFRNIMDMPKKLQGKPPKYKGVHLGSLPSDVIGFYLNREMEAGDVYLTKDAHKHLAEDHPSDYAICFANIQMAIQNPTFIGQDPKHARSFIIIKRVPGPARSNMLVAISLEKNDYGFYTVRSSYLISQEDVDKRRGKSLHQVIATAIPAAQSETASDKSEAVS